MLPSTVTFYLLQHEMATVASGKPVLHHDVANFALYTHCPVLVGVGLIDETCQPADVLAALNELNHRLRLLSCQKSSIQDIGKAPTCLSLVPTSVKSNGCPLCSIANRCRYSPVSSRLLRSSMVGLRLCRPIKTTDVARRHELCYACRPAARFAVAMYDRRKWEFG
ncbi:MAG: hypothetical protein HKL96_00325 [Phycisphaerales bacterium]|nr:hypothetical protein [Phycisphaerales bacterium]